MQNLLFGAHGGVRILTMEQGTAIGKRVSIARRRKRLSMNMLAMRAGTSHGYISQLEGGKIPSPGLERLARIAEVLEVPVSDLLGEVQYDPASQVDHWDDHIDALLELAPDADPIAARRLLEAFFRSKRERQKLLADLAEEMAPPPRTTGDGASGVETATGT